LPHRAWPCIVRCNHARADPPSYPCRDPAAGLSQRDFSDGGQARRCRGILG